MKFRIGFVSNSSSSSFLCHSNKITIEEVRAKISDIIKEVGESNIEVIKIDDHLTEIFQNRALGRKASMFKNKILIKHSHDNSFSLEYFEMITSRLQGEIYWCVL